MVIGFDEWAGRQARKELIEAVRKFKKEHPGVLEEMTRQRKIREQNERDQEWYRMEEEYNARKAAEAGLKMKEAIAWQT